MPSTPFDYAAFIVELQGLIDRARAFHESDEHYDAPKFRAWKHELSDLIRRVQRLRYGVNTGVENRLFRASWPTTGAMSSEDRVAWNRDMTDTVTELDLIATNYEKYGDPKASLKPAPPPPAAFALSIDERITNAIDTVPRPKTELEPPDKVTLYWIFKHMTLGGWATLLALLAAAYSAGVTVGSWPVMQKLLTKWFGV